MRGPYNQEFAFWSLYLGLMMKAALQRDRNGYVETHKNTKGCLAPKP